MMSNSTHERKAALEEYYAEIFARLREQDIEQFYAHYQLWVLRRRASLLEEQLNTLREHLTEHRQVSQRLQPSALALAVLARLQSNGVTDIDLLDLLLDRGEDWLDGMMQRLDYCEQVQDFIQGDYTQWCIKSLEGAYDWIDTLLGSIKENTGHYETIDNNAEATEELLLQKLSLDDDEAMLEATLKQPAVDGTTGGTEPEPLAAAATGAENEESPELLGWQDLESLDVFTQDEDETSKIHPPTPIETALTNQVQSTPEGAMQTGKGISSSGEQLANEETQAPEQQVSVENIPTPANEPEIPEEIQESTQQIAEEYPSQQTEEPSRQEASEEIQAEEYPVPPETIQEEQLPFPVEEPAHRPEWQGNEPQVEAGHESLLAEKPEEPAEPQESKPQAVTENEILPLEEAEKSAEVQEEEELQLPAGYENLPTEESEKPVEVEPRESEPQAFTGHENLPAEEPEESAEAGESEPQELASHENLPTEGSEEPEIREHEQFPTAYREEQDHEIEMAALVNDILSMDEEQAEQLPWYEYLDLKEPGTPDTPGPVEEHIEPEETSVETPADTATNESGAPALHEYAAEATDEEQQSLPGIPAQEATPAEEAAEIEGWQTWNEVAAEEETLPFALKDLQHDTEAPFAPAGAEAQAEPTAEPIAQTQIPEQAEEKSRLSFEETRPEAEFQDSASGRVEIPGAEGKTSVENRDTAPLKIAETENVEDVRSATDEKNRDAEIERIDTKELEVAPVPLRQPEDSGEQGMIKTAEGAENADNLYHNSNPANRAGGTFKPRVVRTDIGNVAMKPRDEYPPRKRNFWQRLFGFGRKSKQR